MQTLHISKKLHEQMSPYKVISGTNGTECTYEVVCQQTGATIASVFYWYRKKYSKMLATAVCHALNSKVDRHYKHPVDTSYLDIFAALYPGPFAKGKDHDWHLSLGHIHCTKTNRSVIDYYDWDQADQIIAALNRSWFRNALS